MLGGAALLSLPSVLPSRAAATDQRPPPAARDGKPWRVWLVLGGRGAGKTRAGAEWLAARAEATPNGRFALVAPTEQNMPTQAPATQRLSAVAMPEYALPKLSDLQRERLKLLEIFEGTDNLVVADYAKLAGKSRRWITYEVQAGNLLSIQLGNKIGRAHV